MSATFEEPSEGATWPDLLAASFPPGSAPSKVQSTAFGPSLKMFVARFPATLISVPFQAFVTQTSMQL